MLELGIGADVLRGAGWIVRILFLVAIAYALWSGKNWKRKLLNVALVLLVFSAPLWPGIGEQIRYKRKYEIAKALFDERCKTAGEKVYGTVDDVEDVLLLKVRDDDRTSNEANPNWIGAGFPRESGGHQYIMEFLYYHRIPTDPRSLHAVLPTPGGIRGYRNVDVLEGGQRVRYTLRNESEYFAAADPVTAHGSRAKTDAPLPRFSVAYEDIQDPEGRDNWIAGGRVTLTDLSSGALLGEFVQYSFESGFGSREGQRQPWAFARECPSPNPGSATTGRIRLFTEKVLKPKQGE